MSEAKRDEEPVAALLLGLVSGALGGEGRQVGRMERVGGMEWLDEGVRFGMPRMEAVIVELWMWVPGPGVWDLEGARARPG